MEDSKMKKHVTVVAAIQIGFAILGLIIAVAIFFVMDFAKSQVGGDDTAEMVLSFLSVSLPILFGFLSTLGLVGGIGLLAYKPWARYIVIVVNALGCLNIPIGTLKGVYSLWVLLQDETVKLFEQKFYFCSNNLTVSSCSKTHNEYTPFSVPIGIFRQPSALTTITMYLAQGLYAKRPIPPTSPRVDKNPNSMGRLTDKKLRTISAVSSPPTWLFAKSITKNIATAIISPRIAKPICMAATTVTCFFIFESSMTFNFYAI